MPAKTPEEAHHLWAQTFNAGDLDGLVALYETDAVFMPQPGQTVSGHAAIRETLQGFLALKPTFNLQFQQALESGDLALLFSRWTLTGTGPDGNELSLSGQTSDVVRRQADGSWLFVIDNPFGGQGVDPVAS
jgi:uncharacterized protein (TIGR02246 family)